MGDLASRVLDAIADAEELAEDAANEGIDTWKPEDPSYWWDTDYPMSGSEKRHIALHDPAAILRRCAADRRTVESYVKTCEIRDEIAGRGLSGSELPPADLDQWDRAQREAQIMLDGIQNLAHGYGIPDEEKS